jgi:hypothetical protein
MFQTGTAGFDFEAAAKRCQLWRRCSRKPGVVAEMLAIEASLLSSGRFIVGSSCNASYNAFTSGFISTAICNQNGDSELTSVGQVISPMSLVAAVMPP